MIADFLFFKEGQKFRIRILKDRSKTKSVDFRFLISLCLPYKNVVFVLL
jgi:hypothetical protein